MTKENSPYMQNRELSWLTFNERVLEQGADTSVPLMERLNFISIFSSNLQEFFMIRVGSLTDLSLVKKRITDNKTNMTPPEQLEAIYERCHEQYPVQEEIFEAVRDLLAEKGVRHLMPEDLSGEQLDFLLEYLLGQVMPVLSPQIINALHPFPHLENGTLYVVVRLDEEAAQKQKEASKPEKDESSDKGSGKEGKKAKGAEGVTLGLVPLPRQSERIIALPGEGFSFILIEHAIELIIPEIFSMYRVKHANVICVTRNADLDMTEGIDESDEDYREHMKRILKKRSRLAAVRLESQRPLSDTVSAFLLKRLNLERHQMFSTKVPLDMGYTFDLMSLISDKQRRKLSYAPFTPQWPACLSRNRSIIEQVSEAEVLLCYPYESIDPFTQLLKEASTDPQVISIKITLYRLASQSHTAEALIAAAENGKEVTALFELRARFDESNNIEWSQRFEQAGAQVIYGFRDYKVHSKICCITRQTEHGMQYITQLGTGNYNEKTARLYTDLCFITTDETFGRDAIEYFRHINLESISDDYDIIKVAPLQIKPLILAGIDREIEKAKDGRGCGLFFKTNSVTDRVVIEKLSEASQAGVPVIMFVRGICCLVPGVAGYTENIKVVSIVGRLLEHSRIFGFGEFDDMHLYFSSADLMTRNMDRRVEVAWPILNEKLRKSVIDYLRISMQDTAKLRELLPDQSYTPLGHFGKLDSEGRLELFDSQDYFISQAHIAHLEAAQEEAEIEANRPRVGIDAEAPVVIYTAIAKALSQVEVAVQAEVEAKAAAAAQVAAAQQEWEKQAPAPVPEPVPAVEHAPATKKPGFFARLLAAFKRS